jgi:glycosyltransferase involved in cell wall biosynthesis
MADGHTIGHSSYYGLEGSVLNLNGIKIYPRAADPYGNDVIWHHARNFGADIVMPLMDQWVLDVSTMPQGMRYVPWYPVDHDPLPQNVKNVISKAYKRIAMSRFGERLTREAGLDCYYVPHGVDTKAFYPVDRAEARKRLGLPESAYIIGTVAMNKGNPSRKCFPQLLEAFASFKSRHTDAIYILHTQVVGAGGVNIPNLCAGLGLEFGKDVIVPEQYGLLLGYGDDFMRDMYSAMDVHLLVSMGEGFGVPIIEAQACGTPVIVGDWTAMPELVFSGRVVDKSDSERQWTGAESFQFIPHVRGIERALEMERKQPSPRDRAVKGAAQYDADLIMSKYWKPVLVDIEKNICHDNMVRMQEILDRPDLPESERVNVGGALEANTKRYAELTEASHA